MATRELAVILTANARPYVSGMQQATQATRQFTTTGTQASASQAALGKATSGLRGVVREATGTMLGFVGAQTAIGAASFVVNTIKDFESAFAGVTKTVEGTPEQLDMIRDGIIAMSERLPASANEISAVAEAAGALGIQTPAVLAFSETMIGLGEATNLSAEEAAETLARFANITQMSQNDFDRLGSTLVDLGNKFASTEAEIANMGLRIAGVGTQVGLSEAEILALATALSSLGIEVEAGGSAISQVMTKIGMAVSTQSTKLNTFARVSGMSADEFSRAWRERPAEALVAFTQGLGAVDAAGGDVNVTLSELEITEIRQSDALRRLANSGDLLERSLVIGNQAWAENSALATETEKRYATFGAQVEIARNRLQAFIIEAGSGILPSLGTGLETAVSFMEALAEQATRVGRILQPALIAGVDAAKELWDVLEPVLKLLGLIGGAAVIAALTVLATTFERVARFAADNRVVIQTLATGALVLLARNALMAHRNLITLAGAQLLTGLQAMSRVVVPIVDGIMHIGTNARFAADAGRTMFSSWGNAAATMRQSFAQARDGMSALISSAAFGQIAFAGLTFVIIDMINTWNSGREAAREFAKSFTTDLDTTNVFEMNDALSAMDAELGRLGKSMSSAGVGDFAAGMADLIIPIHDVENSMLDQAFASEELTREQRELAQQAAHLWNVLQDLARVVGGPEWHSIPTQEMRDFGSAVARVAADANIDLARPWEEIRDPLTQAWQLAVQATPAQAELAGAMQTTANASALAEDKVKAYKSALESLLGVHIAAFDAETKFAEALSGVAGALRDAGGNLDAYNEKGRAARSAYSDAADSAISHAQAVYEETGNMKEATQVLAGHILQMAAEASAAGLSEQQIKDLNTQLGLTPENIETLIAMLGVESSKTELQGIQNQLGDVRRGGHANITADGSNAMSVINTVNGAIRTTKELLDGLSRNHGSLGLTLGGGWGYWQNADGNLFRFYAAGGMENHIAQVAPAGAMRVWAEPETGGEAYIPLARSKRERSEDLLEAVAHLFGGKYVREEEMHERPQHFADGGITWVTRDEADTMMRAGLGRFYEDGSGRGADGRSFGIIGSIVYWEKLIAFSAHVKRLQEEQAAVIAALQYLAAVEQEKQALKGKGWMADWPYEHMRPLDTNDQPKPTTARAPDSPLSVARPESWSRRDEPPRPIGQWRPLPSPVVANGQRQLSVTVAQGAVQTSVIVENGDPEAVRRAVDDALRPAVTDLVEQLGREARRWGE